MGIREQISQLMVEVREYQQQHRELLKSHHFVVAVPLNKGADTFEYLVMGLNPGEQDGNWLAHSGPTEETVDYDWLDCIPRTDSSKRWRTKVEYFCGTTNVLQSDLFFWSTNNIGSAFVDRFGTAFRKSPHLQFCCEINLKLVDLTQPKAVVAPGITHADEFAHRYGLSPVNSIVTEDGHRLIAHFERDRIPWIFTKHWTGSRGFSAAQAELVRGYISQASR